MNKKVLVGSVLMALFLTASGVVVSAQEKSTPQIGYAETKTEADLRLEGVYIESQYEDGAAEEANRKEIWEGEKASEGYVLPEKGSVQSHSSSRASETSEFTYNKLADGTVEILSYTGGDAEVKIPNNINGLKVSRIGKQAFLYNYMESVILPEGIKEIGEAAFYGCSNLKNVSFPKSLRIIEQGAFVNCYNLENIVLKEGLQTIGAYAFQNTAALTLQIPSTVENFDPLALYNCTNFSSYVVKDNPYFASDKGVLFTKDKKILISYPWSKADISYTVPSSVTTIKISAFQGSSKLQTITFGTKIKTIEDWAFSQSGLTQFTLPSSAEKVGYGIVSECPALTKITIKNPSVKTIPYRFAYNSKNLKTVYLSGNIEAIENVAFAECSKLENITFNSGLKTIGPGAFGNCTSLKSVKLPSGLVTIAYQAFFGDTKLVSVDIPNTVKYIYGQAFYQCPVASQIKNLTKLPNVTQDIYQETGTLKIKGQASYTYAYQVLELVNKNRKAAGQKALVMDQELLDAAMQRAAEVAVYFDHIRPYGGSCFEASQKMSGENIALYQVSPDMVMNSWMNSSGHKANILNSGYESVGIGCFYQAKSGTYAWVQCFGRDAAKTAVKKSDATKTFTVYADKDRVKPGLRVSGSSYISQTVGTKFNLLAVALGTVIEPSSFNWKSSNPLVASVSAGGTVKYLAGGTSNISIANKTLPSMKSSVKYWVTAAKYTVKFQGNGGSVPSTSKYVYKGNQYGTLPEPSRKGYTFAGWYTAKSGGSKVTDASKVTEAADHTLYAQWKKTKYSIKYDLSGGVNSASNPSTYYITSNTITLKNPTKKGYAFGGWYTSSSYKTKVTRISKGSTGTKTLYAKWTPIQYTIRYHKNGATGGSMADTRNCKYNTAYNLRGNTYVRTGYKFAGWATSSGGTVRYNDRAGIKNLTTKNGTVLTLYARWSVNNYKITYVLNGGKNNGSNPSGYQVTASAITLKNPVRTGYTFQGWYTTAGFAKKVTKIEKGSVGNQTLYAKWTPNTYTISFEPNGGEGVRKTMSCNYDQEYRLDENSFVRTGYVFTGWNTSPDGSQMTYENLAKVKNMTVTAKGTVKLYAQWMPEPSQP